MEEERKKIKLTEEQILERQIQLEKSQFNLEHSELSLAHFQKMRDSNFTARSAQVEENNLRKQVETLRHNIGALTQQINEGEI